MTWFPFSCCPVGKDTGGTSVAPSVINIGGFVEPYVIGTDNPFEFRTYQSSDASVGITQNADNIDFTVATVTPATMQNVGGFAEPYVAGSSNPFDIRTYQSTDGSVAITQNADNLDFSASGMAATMTNVGTGLDVWDDPTTLPFDMRRMEVIDDGSDLHGQGNLAFWTDGQTNKIDLPRGHVQNLNSITITNVLTFLIDHSFGDDSGGAGVAGFDGEDWMCWWSLKYCGDPSFPLTDAVMRLSMHDGVLWNVLDTVHCRWSVGLVPSSPVTRPFLIMQTDWSGNGGNLRLGIECATNNFAVVNQFEHPSIHIQRFNKL
jgi:hypothetical protein